MILPFLAGPFGVFLMRQFIQTLPDELIQAARVDGAGELRIFFSVILPLCGPALATLGILTFLRSWNNFLWPLVVARPRTSTRCRSRSRSTPSARTPRSTACCSPARSSSCCPVLAVFLLLQRHIMQGIAMTGIK